MTYKKRWLSSSWKDRGFTTSLTTKSIVQTEVHQTLRVGLHYHKQSVAGCRMYVHDLALNREINLRSGKIRWADNLCTNASDNSRVKDILLSPERQGSSSGFDETSLTQSNNLLPRSKVTARDLNGLAVPYHMMIIITLSLLTFQPLHW